MTTSEFACYRRVKGGQVAVITLGLDKRTELSCPKCGRPLVIEHTDDGRARFIGCGRDCLDVYNIPDGSVAFGPVGAPLFLYGPVHTLLRNYEQKPHTPFVGCGLKKKPVRILRGRDGSLFDERQWTQKCGSEKGTDSGLYFICLDCVVKFGYRW